MDRSKNDMDQLLQSIDTSKVQGYQEFMQAIILEGISNHGLNFETLNLFLFEFNKQIYDAVCEKAISKSVRVKNKLFYTSDRDKYKFYTNKIIYLTRLSKAN